MIIGWMKWVVNLKNSLRVRIWAAVTADLRGGFGNGVGDAVTYVSTMTQLN
jgi:hypothetical protein